MPDWPPEKYWDYAAVRLETAISTGDTLGIFTLPEERTFMACAKPLKFDFGTSCYAFTACEKGYEETKYRLNAIHITSDADFDAAHPAGSSLNDIMETEYFMEQVGQVRIPVMELTGEYDLVYATFYIPRPELSQNHRFAFEFFKTNGTMISSTTEEVVWE